MSLARELHYKKTSLLYSIAACMNFLFEMSEMSINANSTPSSQCFRRALPLGIASSSNKSLISRFVEIMHVNPIKRSKSAVTIIIIT